MFHVLLKASAFILIIVLAYVLKVYHVLSPKDVKSFSKLLMNVTLPSALIVSTQSISITATLLLPILIAILGNLTLLGIGYVRGRHKPSQEKAQEMMQLAGYNIGTFAFPFVQSFFPSSYLIYVILFDTGNAFMVFGGNYSLISLIAKLEEKVTVLGMLKKLCRSLPFCTYLFCFCLSLFQVTIPENIVTLVKVAADANPFVAMMVLGLMVDFKFSKEVLKSLGQLLSLRLLGSLIMLVFLYSLPLELAIKEMLTICLIAPISVVTPLYVRQLGSDSSLPATLNSVTILSSVALMTLFMVFFVS
ncbi:AEC family transporter [Streptococcus ictaluri]|uniref:Transporter, auxin efflux carrier domain protein n=1 Tax=Streptococcus ictaluri 707-05 TaxID=764299 RepID=G5K162_9STRE|nr:hypothetical protein [Streptococcus ictaluri]EHI70398.1 transporter, auxin efflux carrier domain protein [Streptococcus ictaluri 707-05]